MRKQESSRKAKTVIAGKRSSWKKDQTMEKRQRGWAQRWGEKMNQEALTSQEAGIWRKEGAESGQQRLLRPQAQVTVKGPTACPATECKQTHMPAQPRQGDPRSFFTASLTHFLSEDSWGFYQRQTFKTTGKKEMSTLWGSRPGCT